MSEDDFTRPERAAQICQAKRYRLQIIKDGGCSFCMHRDREVLLWGRSICGTGKARSFPACIHDGKKPEFTLDESQLGAEHGSA